MKISWAGKTNWTCQNNSPGLYAVPCSCISWGTFQTKRISTGINSPGILLLQLSVVGEEPCYHTTALGTRMNNCSAWLHPPPCAEHALEDPSAPCPHEDVPSQVAGTRTSQARHAALSHRHPHARGRGKRQKSSRTDWKNLRLVPLQRWPSWN